MYNPIGIQNEYPYPSTAWIEILTDADAKSADATVALIRSETQVRVFPSGRSVLTFGKIGG